MAARWERYVERWTNAGLIDASTAERIGAYEAGRLIAEADPQPSSYDPSDLHVRFVQRRGEKLAVLDDSVAFFIPEHVPDPSIRPQGEELWVEVTIPKKGPPRPIRLGIKKGDAPIVPLELG